MELIVIPVLALAGLLYSLDLNLGFNLLGGGGDDDDGEPNPNLNREEFEDTDDVTSGTTVTDFLFLNGGGDLASGGEGADRIFLGAGQDATVVLGEDGSFDTVGMEGNDLIRGGEGVMFWSIRSGPIRSTVTQAMTGSTPSMM